MRNITIKILSVFAILTLGLSLAACGKGADEDTKEVSEESRYEYVSKASEHEFKFTNEYLVGSEIQGDVLSGIKMSSEETDGNYTLRYFYGKYNFADGTKEENEIPAEIFGESFNVSKVHSFDDGSIIVIGSNYDPNTFEASYDVRIIKDFALVKSFSLDELITDGGYFNNVVFTDENMFFDTGSAVIVTDYDGKEVFRITIDSWIGQLFSLPDGSVAATYTDTANNYQYVTKKIDVAAKGFGEAVNIEVGDGTVFSGKDRSVLIMTSTALKKWDPQTQETKELFQLMNADIYDNYFENITEGENDTYYFYRQDYEDETMSNVYGRTEVRKVEASKNGKQKLIFGCMYLDWDVKERIIDFNKSSDKYKIEIKDYSADSEDWEAVESRFAMDVASGDVMDIVDCSSIAYFEYVKSGAFEDLSSYIENDADITAENYYTGVFEAFKTDGKLFVMPTSVSFQTVATPSRIANGKTSWTVNDVLELRKQYPDISFMDYPSKTSALFEVLMGSYADYVDTEKAECHFDSEEFVALLNFANTFYNDNEFAEDRSTWAEVKNGNVFMYNMYIYDGDSYSMAESLYGEPITLIGYPSSTGAGTLLGSQALLAIGSKSDNKDGAWEFIKSGLSESNQNKVFSGFPISKKAFDAKMKEATAVETYIDENGETQIQSHGSMSDGTTTIELTNLSKEGEKVIRGLMENSANYSFSALYDEEIIAIISEEAEGFFAGQKKAEDVAAVIQSRVKIYLAEKN